MGNRCNFDEYLSFVGKTMPERNLVVKFKTVKCAYVVLIATMILAPLGCSELRQSTQDRDLFGDKRTQPTWTKDPLDSADRYIEDTNDVLDAETQKDQARIVGVSKASIDPDQKQIKLTADPAAHSYGMASHSASTFNSPCDHQAQCDCFKRQLKPKLPHAEPIDPPPISTVQPPEKSASPGNQVPPQGVVSQRLSPILFDPTTRETENNEAADQKINSLRQQESWTLENPAEIGNKPDVPVLPPPSTEFSATEPDSRVLNNTADRVSHELRTVDWRDTNESTTVPFVPQSNQSCKGCASLNCDGRCSASDRRSATERLPVVEQKPVVEREPVIIVATTSADTIPPYAECPSEEDADTTIELEFQNPESNAQPTELANPSAPPANAKSMERPIVDTRSFVDIEEEQWSEIWASAKRVPATPQLNSEIPTKIKVVSCAGCESIDCIDPDCPRPAIDSDTTRFNLPPTPSSQTSPVAAPSTPVSVDSFVAVPVDEKPIESDAFAVQSIDVTASPETANQFSPATHLVDAPVSEPTDFVPPATDVDEFQAPDSFPDSAAMNSEAESPETVSSDNVSTDPVSTDAETAEIEDEDATSSNDFVTPVDPTDNKTSEGTDYESQSEPQSDSAFSPPTKFEANPVERPVTIVLPKLANINTTVHVPDATPVPLLDRFSAPTSDSTASPSPLPENQPLQMITSEAQVVEEEEALFDPELEVQLRLLESLRLQMDSLQQRSQPLSDSENQFWRAQLETLGGAFDQAISSDSPRLLNALQTLDNLRESLTRLESNSDLQVLNGVFCTEISGFGQYKSFPASVFRAGQRVLVYCEVENYTTATRTLNQETTFHTTLRGSFVIRDEQGRAVQQAKFADVEDVSSTRRRDFYMYFPIQLGDLPPGQYRLNLHVEDTLNSSTASLDSGIAFQIQ